MTLWNLFLIGLAAGNSIYLYLQSGPIIAYIVGKDQTETEKRSVDFTNYSKPMVQFLTGRLVIFILVGGVLGLFHQLFLIISSIQYITGLIAGILFIFTALNLFKWPSWFISHYSRATFFVSKKITYRKFSIPFVLGISTIFIPDSVTISIEQFVSTTNLIMGILYMGVFILGTIPVLFSVGYLISALSKSYHSFTVKMVSTVLILLGILAINNGLVALDAPVTLEKIREWSPVQIDLSGS